MTGAGARTGTRTVRIGITGPIGCGKSQVAAWLGDRGALVVDADRVARDVTAPGGRIHAAILRRFGAPAWVAAAVGAALLAWPVASTMPLV